MTLASFALAPLRSLLKQSFVGDVGRFARVMLWTRQGRPVPPPTQVKRSILATYAATFHTPTLIETGTYFGDTIYAMRSRFASIYSIELDHTLADRAKQRFLRSPHIHIVEGDSGTVLAQILGNISTPCIFWLDGHYSGGVTAQGETETPIMLELATILDHTVTTHIILIDDARCFTGTHGYPTLDDLRNYIALKRPEYSVVVSNDVIRVHPPSIVQSKF